VHQLWRRRWLVGLLVLAYLVVAVSVLPQLIVSLTAGKADANTQLNAVTSTRAALLGLLTPLVIVLGGVVGFLNFQEIRAQNALTNDRARAERDETRRLRRAEVYAGLTSACQECWEASNAVYNADRDNVNTVYDAGREAHPYLWYVSAISEKSGDLNLAHDRVMLLGADAVQASAVNLVLHCHKEIAAKAGKTPKVSEEEWQRNAIVEYNRLHRAFLDAARSDLEPTR